MNLSGRRLNWPNLNLNSVSHRPDFWVPCGRAAQHSRQAGTRRVCLFCLRESVKLGGCTEMGRAHAVELCDSKSTEKSQIKHRPVPQAPRGRL